MLLQLLESNEVRSLIDELKRAIAQVTQLRVEEPVEDQEQELRTRPGEPTEAELAKIIELTGVESKASDWLVVPFHASNSSLDLSQRKWEVSAIASMGLTAVGKPLLTNHDWGDVSSQKGFLFESKLIAEQEVNPEILEGAGFEDYNRKAIEDDGGFYWLYLCAAVPMNSETAESVLSRKAQNSSTGSLLNEPYMVCPNCTREARKLTKDRNKVVCFHDKNEKGRDA